MKKQSLFVANFLKQYKHICPGITESWYAKDVQEKFNSYKSKKCCTHQCVPEEGSSPQKCTCFILFCMDRRKQLQEENPHVPNKQITSMLAKEWRDYKRLAQEDIAKGEATEGTGECGENKNIYNTYKNRYQKMVFFDKHKNVVKERYPELDEQELELALEKLYIKYTNKK